MCDASGVALCVVLGHRRDKILHPIYYARKALNEAQRKYNVTESVGGHHSGIRIALKILQCGYYCPTIHQDAYEFAKAFYRCQRDGAVSRQQKLPLNFILQLSCLTCGVLTLWSPF